MRSLQLKVIGNWTLGREKGDKTENRLLIALFARELKETEGKKAL